MRLRGTIAVITGAGSGPGWATAHRMAAEGAIVIVDDVNADTVANEIIKDAGRARAVEPDVTQPGRDREIFKDVANRFGRLDMSVNNAGILWKPYRTGCSEFASGGAGMNYAASKADVIQMTKSRARETWTV
ncbi:MAG: SDR family NAD(P)-dependent oxidoreductase [Mesorhizobium sp.]|nr:MAG: SDR family NAD(P)-dependent oxidoreductase [Mesorhizobium sp.]